MHKVIYFILLSYTAINTASATSVLKNITWYDGSSSYSSASPQAGLSFIRTLENYPITKSAITEVNKHHADKVLNDRIEHLFLAYPSIKSITFNLYIQAMSYSLKGGEALLKFSLITDKKHSVIVASNDYNSYSSKISGSSQKFVLKKIDELEKAISKTEIKVAIKPMPPKTPEGFPNGDLKNPPMDPKPTKSVENKKKRVDEDLSKNN